MITEDYVSFEVAKLLKEKGFDEVTSKWYLKYKGEYSLVSRGSAEHTDDSIDVPTLQMAMKWLREKHKITIGIVFERDRIYYEIHQNNEFVCGVDTPKSYEEACEAAIKYTLKNLIN